MAKQVLTNPMVAHVWAQQTQESGRSANGNFWFEGRTLYSYRTPVARIFQGSTGQRVVLRTTQSHSPSTAKQMNMIGRAVEYTDIRVPYIGESGGRHSEPMGCANESTMHELNTAALVQTYDDRVKNLIRVKQIWGDMREILEATRESIERYTQAFGLPFPHRHPATDCQTIITARAEREAKNSSPAQIAKRARERARKEEREIELRRVANLKSSERVAEWLMGHPVTLQHGEGYNADRSGVLLRVRGDILETGLGVQVPLAHAVRVFQLAKYCKATGRVWQKNGQTVRVGQFQVDAVRNDGSIIAGCHTIQWAEIESAARTAGAFDMPMESPHYVASSNAMESGA